MRSSSIILLAAFVATALAECPSTEWIDYGGTNKCFRFLESSLSHKEAGKACEEMGAALVSVCSFFENQFVRGITRGRNTWLESKTDCEYKHYLHGNEPDNEKSCRVMGEDWEGRWAAASCGEEKHSAICQIEQARPSISLLPASSSFLGLSFFP